MVPMVWVMRAHRWCFRPGSAWGDEYGESIRTAAGHMANVHIAGVRSGIEVRE
jgi:hypothetical protein